MKIMILEENHNSISNYIIYLRIIFVHIYVCIYIIIYLTILVCIVHIDSWYVNVYIVYH